MTEYEAKVLHAIRMGLLHELPWGAAKGAAMEFLRSSGYIREDAPLITQKGKQALEEHG